MLHPFKRGNERTKGERIIRRGDETGESGAVIIPKTAESPTESVKRYQSILAPLSCAVTFKTQQGGNEFRMTRIKQGKQESIHEQNHSKKLETSIKGP